MTIKLRRPRVTKENRLRVITDYNAGMSLDNIQRRYNIKSKSTVYKILKEMK